MPPSRGSRMPPMETRSFIRVVRATAQPWPTAPSRWLSGMRTPVRKTSLNSASPVIWRSGRTSTPGACMSQRKYVMPWCLGSAGSVRAIRMAQRAVWALEVHTFCPSTIQSPVPLSRTARVPSAARSEPAPGSLKSWHQTSSPTHRGRRKRCFCSSVPYARIVGAAMPRPMPIRRGSLSGAPAASSSASTTAWRERGAPSPPRPCG